MYKIITISVFCYALTQACENKNPCYNTPEPIGCFPINPSSPFCKDYFAPQSPQKIDPSFALYTPQSPNTAQQLDYIGGNLNSTIKNAHSIDWAKPLIMIVHGFQSSNKSWLVDAKNAIMRNNYQMNVILCYWTHGSKGPDYPQAVANTRVMGAMMGLVIGRINDLIPQFNIQASTLAGFSLGGHVIGFAANWVQQNKGIFLPFLNGIDPAGPWFEGYPPVTRLDPTDAKFVQAFHTDGVPLAHIPPGYGTHQAMGHVDFWVNDGASQPGCGLISNAEACSHERATEVFIAGMDLNTQTQCQKFHAFPGNSNDYDSWNAGKYFNTQAACTNWGILYRTQGSCSGSYYFGTTDGTYPAAIKYFGSQYLFTFTFPTAGFFHPSGTIAVRFYYNGNAESTKATEDIFDDDSITLEGTMSTVLTTPCDSLSLSSNGVPNKVGLTYDASLTSSDTVNVNSLVITKVDGSKWNVGGFQLTSKKEVVMNLS